MIEENTMKTQWIGLMGAMGLLQSCLGTETAIVKKECFSQTPLPKIPEAQMPDSLIFDIVVRDFQPTHPDFETFEVGNPNSSCTRDPKLPTLVADNPTNRKSYFGADTMVFHLNGLKATKGMINSKLGTDGKPVKPTDDVHLVNWMDGLGMWQVPTIQLKCPWYYVEFQEQINIP